jgi:hypothetical protein
MQVAVQHELFQPVMDLQRPVYTPPACAQEVDDLPQVVPTVRDMQELEVAIRDSLQLLDVDALTSHYFCEGQYARELQIPKGHVVVGKMHATENFFVLTKGDMTIWTPLGMKRVHAPFMCVTRPGDKRVGFAHEDSTTINFHANVDNEQDLLVLEDRYIIPERLGYDGHERKALQGAA